MLRGLYVATAGMLSESARHAIHSTNIANINTPGYRARRPVVGDFQRLWVQQLAGGAHHVLGTAGTGPALVAVTNDTEQGPLRETGRSLDLALEGPGFFVVQTPAGPAYTRSGDFRLDADGRLVTAEGFAVLGERGEIILPSPEVTVAPDGTIFAGDDELGRLRLVTFVAPEFLERSGSGTFTATAASGPPVPDGATRVHQGFLEGANGSVVSLAVELLASLRAYEASQQAVRLQSEALRLASTELGRIG